MHIVGTDSDTGQCHFKQKGSDKNDTRMSPSRLSVLQGFVFTSNQVLPEDSMVIGSVATTNISHGFGIYSHAFRVFPRICYGSQTPRLESSNYSVQDQDQNKESMFKGQDQNKGIIHWRSRSE